MKHGKLFIAFSTAIFLSGCEEFEALDFGAVRNNPADESLAADETSIGYRGSHSSGGDSNGGGSNGGGSGGGGPGGGASGGGSWG